MVWQCGLGRFVWGRCREFQPARAPERASSVPRLVACADGIRSPGVSGLKSSGSPRGGRGHQERGTSVVAQIRPRIGRPLRRSELEIASPDERSSRLGRFHFRKWPDLRPVDLFQATIAGSHEVGKWRNSRPWAENAPHLREQDLAAAVSGLRPARGSARRLQSQGGTDEHLSPVHRVDFWMPRPSARRQYGRSAGASMTVIRVGQLCVSGWPAARDQAEVHYLKRPAGIKVAKQEGCRLRWVPTLRGCSRQDQDPRPRCAVQL